MVFIYQKEYPFFLQEASIIPNSGYYTEYVLIHCRYEFPGLVSYNRFVELTPAVIVPLSAYLQQRQGNCTGLAFVDATAIKVCHNKRIPRHKVFAGCSAGQDHDGLVLWLQTPPDRQ